MNLVNALLNYFIACWLIPLAIATIGNIITGTALAISQNTFSWAKAFQGVKDWVMLVIGYGAMGIFAYSVKDVALADVSVFSGLFVFLTTALVLIKGNSLALNFLALAKMPHFAVMDTFDAKVKEYLERAKPDFLGLTEDEG
jgi:uncharacterized paraquat-inducible protein A